jgi:hypothetical protein
MARHQWEQMNNDREVCRRCGQRRIMIIPWYSPNTIIYRNPDTGKNTIPPCKGGKCKPRGS